METSYKRAVTGLGVCLAIAVIYGVVMTILAGLDCMQRLNKKRLKAIERRKAQGHMRHRDPYEDAETLQVSGQYILT